MNADLRAYRDVPVGSEHIRLLKLFPARLGAALRGELVSYRIVDEGEDRETASQINFATLSYRWERRADFETLALDSGVIYITSGVAHALRRLRDLHVRYVWVDQISINQHDDAEKSQQILLMRRIYSAARECFVYLGPGIGSEGAEQLASLKSFIKWRSQSSDDYLRSIFKRKGEPLPFIETCAECFRDLVGQSYFTRVWVVQELIASRTVTCLWGESTFGWDVIRACAFIIPMRQGLAANPAFQAIPGVYAWEHPYRLLMDHKADWKDIALEATQLKDPGGSEKIASNDPLFMLDISKDQQTERFARRFANFNRFMELLESLRTGEKLNLYRLLCISRFLRATDDRDKVYAMLGLAADSQDFPRPDYGCKSQQVMAAIAEVFVKQGFAMNMLSRSGLHISPDHVATWVPDWSDQDMWWNFEDQSTFTASPDTHTPVKLDTNGSMHVDFAIVDAVEQRCNFSNPPRGLSRKLAALCYQALDEMGIEKTAYLSEDRKYRVADLVFFDYHDMPTKSQSRSDAFRNFRFRDFTLTAMSYMSTSKLRESHFIDASNTATDENAGWGSMSTMKMAPSILRTMFANKLPDCPLKDEILENASRAARSRLSMQFIRNRMRDYLMYGGMDFIWFLSRIEDSARIVRTKRRRLGLAPSKVNEGDLIGIFRGARAPSIVRRTSSGRYQNVGQAYVRGFMDGEAFDDARIRYETIEIH